MQNLAHIPLNSKNIVADAKARRTAGKAHLAATLDALRDERSLERTFSRALIADAAQRRAQADAERIARLNPTANREAA